MTRLAVSLCLLLLNFAVCTSAQELSAPALLKEKVSRGLQRSDVQTFRDAAKTGENGAYEVDLAILAAGKTGDSFWVSDLKPFLKYARNKNQNLAELAPAAQLALAKLGEKEQLQEILCEADFGSASIQNHAITKLKYVDGWFSIKILLDLLEERPKYKELLRDSPGDEVFVPQGYALEVLPEIVPNPPMAAPPRFWMAVPEKLAPQRQAWREWIEKNRESLAKLSPTADGMEASEKVCKPILKKDQLIDRSQLQH
jgi:hypothetical protein